MKIYYLIFTILMLMACQEPSDLVESKDDYNRMHTLLIQDKESSFELTSHNITQNVKSLGTIKVENIDYYVFTSFMNMGGKGVSDIVFLNNLENRFYKYRIDIPQYLPLLIEDDSLVFIKKNDTIKSKVLNFKDLFCSPVGGCVELLKQSFVKPETFSLTLKANASRFCN